MATIHRVVLRSLVFVRIFKLNKVSAIAFLRGAMALLCGLCAMPALAGTPVRVVSMNLCTDQLAMLLADEGQLISVSRIASDPRSSAMVEQAARYRSNSGQAEEIFLMQPDLVLAGSFTARASVNMLERLDIPVVKFKPADGLDEVRARIIEMGTALGHPERAEALAADFDIRLAEYTQEVRERPRAALYYANGYTSGDKTLAGQILTAAGFDNITAEVGFNNFGSIPLEVLAMTQPDTVVTSRPYPGGSRSEEIMDHPVVEALRSTRPDASLTDSDWVCGTPFVLEAIADMATLRKQVQRP